MPKTRVFVDTCIIIEAFQTSTWSSLCERYDVETVEKCVEECSTGDVTLPDRANIPEARLRADLAKIHAVSTKDLMALNEIAGLPIIDEGERHLMAWLYANRPKNVAVLVSTSDRAAVRAAHVLRLLDQVCSLEFLLKNAGVSPKKIEKLRKHFLEEWMIQARTRIVMNVL